MNSLQKTALIGSSVSLVALAVSLSLPWLLGPGVSWEEASYGYLPAGVALIGFQLMSFLTAGKSNAATEPAETSNRRAIGNVLAIGLIIGGLVGAGFSATMAYECRQIGQDTVRSIPVLDEEIKRLQAEVAPDDPDQPNAKREELELKLRERQYIDPESYYSDARTFSYFAAGGLAAVLLGIAWFIRSWRLRTA
ncbi:MAG: hypothetical protein JNL18_00930 [Planctomycetaceae bacterium]|nr:hypothetical protein [Planctomycetaceae bacterium]